jgi:hypothetical protein
VAEDASLQVDGDHVLEPADVRERLGKMLVEEHLDEGLLVE